MKTFPWPLITDNPETSDYTKATISLDSPSPLRILATKDGIEVEWIPTVNSNYINNLLSQNKVAWEVEITCPSTMLLKRVKIKKGEIYKDLLSFNDYRRTVSIVVYIKCTDVIHNFKPDGISDDIPNIEFQLKSGDIIGRGEVNIFADPRFNKSPGMRSLFKIEPAKNDDIQFRFDNIGDFYKITLGKKIYDNFEKSWRNNNSIGRKAASGLVVLTPLSLIIERIMKNSEEGTTNAEACLLQLIKEAEIDIKETKLSSIEIALKLLENSKVLETSFDKISKR